MEGPPGLPTGVLEGACRKCGELSLQIVKVASKLLQLLKQHQSAHMPISFDTMVENCED